MNFFRGCHCHRPLREGRVRELALGRDYSGPKGPQPETRRDLGPGQGSRGFGQARSGSESPRGGAGRRSLRPRSAP